MSQDALKLLVAQINPIVGNLEYNSKLILDIIEAHGKTHDVILFPELALSGYSPEDLLFQDEFHEQLAHYLQKIQAATPSCHVILGHPQRRNEDCYNAASVFFKGKRIAHYHKQMLPNMSVFDEKRYFSPGEPRACILTINSIRIGICICEDIWHPEPIAQLVQADVGLLLSLNASPYHQHKLQKRLDCLTNIAKQGISVVYANLVGAQDELIFDGQSLCMHKQGALQGRALAFTPDLQSITYTPKGFTAPLTPALSIEAELYEALLMGTRDYCAKTGFKKALVGLSGGIDSALTLAIAADALGAKNVTAVKMPSRYTQNMSNEDADRQIEALGVCAHTFSIEPAFETFLKTLNPVFSAHRPNIAEENLQARIRGTLLMALSNKTHQLVLTTSNKSEAAMGYSTLYGDMAGGLNILKDVYKTQVYALARYRNTLSEIIPERVLTRPPSAELAEGQTDQDSLPPYEVLDPILIALIEERLAPQQLVSNGVDPKVVELVTKALKRNEYKRQQAPMGFKVSARAFGRDWRFPIVNQF